MFLDLFYALRKHGIDVSIQEWLALMKALSLGLEKQSLTGFYHLSRSLLVKTEADFDSFDEAFLEIFGDLEVPIDLPEKLREWLSDPLRYEKLLSPDLVDKLRTLGLEELLKLFEQRLREQKEAHHGGSRWIGTGGTSPLGHSGYHPSGLRIGGPGHARRAIRVAEERRFRAYRHDRVLDTRQIKVALRRLRELRREGIEEELDIDATIEKTCRNAGELELVFRAPRINDVRLLLLMDVGGTMEPHAHLVERLFSAAFASRHLKDFRYYFFHNCVYAKLYQDEWLREPVSTLQVLREVDQRYKLVIVGDASMAPTELVSPWGALYRDEMNPTSGQEWLEKLAGHFSRSVWINPEPPGNWRWGTTAAIGRMFPMHHLSIDGLDGAVQTLVGARGAARAAAANLT
ncbi:MAG: VWA domain-containing protein [Deltaproteobacteria bacterium]|nr:VWA domain-containing protein [Deltaproteobacteria bacterium]